VQVAGFVEGEPAAFPELWQWVVSFEEGFEGRHGDFDLLGCLGIGRSDRLLGLLVGCLGLLPHWLLAKQRIRLEWGSLQWTPPG
jgi:hypothetical protein